MRGRERPFVFCSRWGEFWLSISRFMCHGMGII
jgi:hypothetical protein